MIQQKRHRLDKPIRFVRIYGNDSDVEFWDFHLAYLEI